MGRVDAQDRYSSISAEEIKALESAYVFSAYQRYGLLLSHGSRACLFDLDGCPHGALGVSRSRGHRLNAAPSRPISWRPESCQTPRST